MEISKVEQAETPALETCIIFFLLPVFVLVFFRDTACLFVEKPCLWVISLPPLERHPYSPPVSPFSSKGASWPEFAPAGSDPGRHLRRSLLQLGSRWIAPRVPQGLTGFPASSPGEAVCVREGGSKLGPELALVPWMRCWRCWGSFSIACVTLLCPGAGTAGWQSRQSGT